MEKLLAIVSLGQNIYGKWLFRRILSSAIVGVGLAIVTSAMMGAMLMGSIYAAYLGLLYAGLTPHIAMAVIFAVSLTATGLLVMLTLRQLRRLREIPQGILQGRAAPPLSQAGDVLDAFLNGLMGS